MAHDVPPAARAIGFVLQKKNSPLAKVMEKTEGLVSQPVSPHGDWVARLHADWVATFSFAPFFFVAKKERGNLLQFSKLYIYIFLKKETSFRIFMAL